MKTPTHTQRYINGYTVPFTGLTAVDLNPFLNTLEVAANKGLQVIPSVLSFSFITTGLGTGLAFVLSEN